MANNIVEGHSSDSDSKNTIQLISPLPPSSKYLEYGKKSKDPKSLWYYFLRETGGQSGQCKLCENGRILKTLGGSTKGLHGHLRGIHKIDLLKKDFLSGMMTNLMEPFDESSVLMDPLGDDDVMLIEEDERKINTGVKRKASDKITTTTKRNFTTKLAKAKAMMGSSRPIAYLTRREHFSACHRLYSKFLSEDENFIIYSKCANENGHGHNYYVEVTVKGPVDPRTGMVMNIADIKHAMDRGIMQPLDHKNIDKDIPFFQNMVSTTENLAIFIWNQMKDYLESPELLHEVKIWETEKNIVTYRGE